MPAFNLDSDSIIGFDLISEYEHLDEFLDQMVEYEESISLNSPTKALHA